MHTHTHTHTHIHTHTHAHTHRHIHTHTHTHIHTHQIHSFLTQRSHTCAPLLTKMPILFLICSVQAELRRSGLESSNLIIALDFTKVPAPECVKNLFTLYQNVSVSVCSCVHVFMRLLFYTCLCMSYSMCVCVRVCTCAFFKALRHVALRANLAALSPKRCVALQPFLAIIFWLRFGFCREPRLVIHMRGQGAF